MHHNKLYAIEQHDQLLDLWRQQDVHNLSVVHMDFHCDMRGLLINRERQRAYGISDFLWGIDEGNFLTHAILEKKVSKLLWIHQIPGGRDYDHGTVKYESDAFALSTGWVSKHLSKHFVPFEYRVIQLEDWDGFQDEDVLDIDWDYFACKQYSTSSIDQRVATFLSTKFLSIPPQTVVCYSPNYSHPSREQFENFISELAIKFSAEIIRLPSPLKISIGPNVVAQFQPNRLYRVYFWLYQWYQRIKYGLIRRIRLLKVSKG
jgi:hypothetical protein